jgi:hypothetical protein
MPIPVCWIYSFACIWSKITSHSLRSCVLLIVRSWHTAHSDALWHGGGGKTVHVVFKYIYLLNKGMGVGGVTVLLYFPADPGIFHLKTTLPKFFCSVFPSCSLVKCPTIYTSCSKLSPSWDFYIIINRCSFSHSLHCMTYIYLARGTLIVCSTYSKLRVIWRMGLK